MSVPAHPHRIGPSGLRLTGRGRAVLVALVALLLLAGLWLGAHRGAGAASGGEARPSRMESVIVGPHETLWDIAVRTRPGVDPRITVQRMIDLNSLDGSVIQPGQRLYLPSR